VAGALVITVAGEVDFETISALDEALASAAEEAPPVVIADFTEVTFMDSTGLNALLTAHRELLARGRRLALAGAQPAVLRVLDLTGADKVIPIYSTVDQALHP
jgi:stage II sporulation protein AA (anti-sigma F factor antagonist)